MGRIISLAAMLIAAAAAGCAAGEVKTFPAAGLAGINVATDSGAVSVTARESAEISVEVLEPAPDRCRVTMAAEGGRLRLEAEGIKYRPPASWSNLFGLLGRGEKTDCHTGFKVLAPAGLPLVAASGTGDMEISGLTGALALRSGTGDMRLSKVTGDLGVKTGTGDLSGEICAKSAEVRGGTGEVRLTGLCGSADVKTGTGGVKLAWGKLPAAGYARAVTGTADIELTFPAGAALGVIMNSGTGSLKNEFDGKGGFEVNARSGTGDISVLKAK